MRLGGGSQEKGARGRAVRADGAGRGRPAGGQRRKRQRQEDLEVLPGQLEV